MRAAARLIGRAASVAVFEDLGVQMSLHSTLVSYLEKLAWALTGNFAKPGAQYAASAMAPLGRVRRVEASSADDGPRSPVAGARIVSGLVPCNVIPEEILTDHPARYRAMVVESGNPAHSLADSPRMREALASLETLVVIDVAMTETARLADVVLPAPTQFEKWEATFFNFEFPRNAFHLRRPLLDAPDGPLPEPEIHARLVEASGALAGDGVADAIASVRAAADVGRAEFADAFFGLLGAHPELGPLAPALLYRTLGPTLPDGAASAAALWAAAHRCAQANPDGVRRAGFGEGLEAGEALFEAILSSPSGVVITDDDHDEAWRRLTTDDGRIHLAIPVLLDELAALATEAPPAADPDWPLVLSAGERRAFSANTIFRDPAWRKRDVSGLRVSPADAALLGLADGDRARLTTPRGTAEVDGRGARQPARRPRVPAQRPGRRPHRRRWRDRRRGRGPQRAHVGERARPLGRHAAPQARPGAPGTAGVGRIDQDAGMTRDEWIAAFAAELGVDPPDAETVETLLDLAGTAAHASERTAAPIACYLVGLAGAAVAPDISPDRAARIAESIGPPAS